MPLGVRRQTSLQAANLSFVGDLVWKHENVPHNAIGMQKLVSSKYREWSSTVGCFTCIFEVSFTTIPASR